MTNTKYTVSTTKYPKFDLCCFVAWQFCAKFIHTLAKKIQASKFCGIKRMTNVRHAGSGAAIQKLFQIWELLWETFQATANTFDQSEERRGNLNSQFLSKTTLSLPLPLSHQFSQIQKSETVCQPIWEILKLSGIFLGLCIFISLWDINSIISIISIIPSIFSLSLHLGEKDVFLSSHLWGKERRRDEYISLEWLASRWICAISGKYTYSE